MTCFHSLAAWRFFFGMHYMGESLEKRAGNQLKAHPGAADLKPCPGRGAGGGGHRHCQSSSATTVMIVGFVSSGIMALRQAISVVMGANIGTTITAWFLSLTGIKSDNLLVSLFKPANFSPLFAFAGIILLFSSKRKKDLAGIFLGFAILMFGMEQMSSSVSGLSQNEGFVSLITLFSNPLFGVAIGAVVTAILQSSSASVGVLQALSNTGIINYATAIPIIMGQNIGTCVTAIISSIGANTNAKRVAAVHLIFNILGTLVFLALFYLANWAFRFTFVAHSASAFGIALTHTISTSCLWRCSSPSPPS